MKRVNQFERTDRDITNAVFALMETKPFEKITVQDILDEAMINRTTFYKHFQDKYAVLERVQEDFVSGMSERIDQLLSEGADDMGRISSVLYDYMTQHQERMKKLIGVHAEGLDMEGQMRRLFIQYLRQSGGHLTALEEDILSGMLVRFLVNFLKNGEDPHRLPEMMLDVYLDISLLFFRVEDVPNAKKRFLELVGSMHQHEDRGEGEGTGIK